MEIKAGGQTTTITGSGVFSMAKLLGTMKMDFGGPIGQTMDSRMLGRTMYFKSDLLTGPAAGKWVKIDFEKATGLDPAQLAQYQNQNPASGLSFLEAVSGGVQKVGTETVRGVATIHYRATVDLTKLGAKLPARARSLLRNLRETAHLSSLPVEVWIATDGIARRFSYSMGPLTMGSETGSATATMELYDFGVPVSVKAPPAADVIDFDSLKRR